MTPFQNKKIASYGILISLALILSYVETLIPPFFPIPGIKLGITNIVVLYALYNINYKAAIFINIIRIILVFLLFGNGMSFLFSLFGCFFSFIIMVIAKNILMLKQITVSIAGGIFHNLGQIVAAIIFLQTASILWYFCILWFSGIISGFFIGLLCYEICKRIK